MNIKDNTIEETFAQEAVRELPEVKQMLVESTGIHTVLALSLADIYSSEAKRLKAKNPADPRVAEAKLKKSIAEEKAKEIGEVLVSRKSPAKQPATGQPKKNEDVIPDSAGHTKSKESEPLVASRSPGVRPQAKAAPGSKVASKIKAKPNTKSRAKPSRTKPVVKKAPGPKPR
jgi:hypothetical protein